MKYSKQREMVLNALIDNKIHPTADTIYGIIKKDLPTISLATVYRNLNQLADNGDILKIQIPGEPDRFDSTICDHHHFNCVKCGSVCDIMPEDINLGSIANINGNVILDYQIILKGICKECQNQ